MAEFFANYIKTDDDGKKRLNQGTFKGNQYGQSPKANQHGLSSYMGQALVSAYTDCHFSGNQYTDDIHMSQVTTQLTGGLETVMTSAAERIGEILTKALGDSMNFNADAFANAFSST